MYVTKYLRNRVVALGGALLIAGIGTQGAMAMEAHYDGPEGAAKAAAETRTIEVGGKVAWGNAHTGKGESTRVNELDVAGKVGPVLVPQREQ